MKSRLHLLRRRPCTAVADWMTVSNSGCSYQEYRISNQGGYRTVTSGTTRGATAAMTRDVKRNLVELLFRDKQHKRIDSTILERYSYEDLRREYLKRLQVIHPDKINANAMELQSENKVETLDPLRSKEERKKEFQELQSTWDRYEELTKSMMKVVHGDGAAANFTQFGVGCSFSDSEEERALRTEITDQACRGWFSSGLVSAGSNDDAKSKGDGREKAQNRKSLIDDSIFVQDDLSNENTTASSNSETKADTDRRQRRTLIPGIN